MVHLICLMQIASCHVHPVHVSSPAAAYAYGLDTQTMTCVHSSYLWIRYAQIYQSDQAQHGEMIRRHGTETLQRTHFVSVLLLLASLLGSLSLIGPLTLGRLTTLPFCVTSISPLSANSFATARTAGIRGRQSSGLMCLGASLGQQLEPALRLCSNSSMQSPRA